MVVMDAPVVAWLLVVVVGRRTVKQKMMKKSYGGTDAVELECWIVSVLVEEQQLKMIACVSGRIAVWHALFLLMSKGGTFFSQQE